MIWIQSCAGMFLPDPGSDFFPSRIPDPGSGSATLFGSELSSVFLFFKFL